MTFPHLSHARIPAFFHTGRELWHLESVRSDDFSRTMTDKCTNYVLCQYLFCFWCTTSFQSTELSASPSILAEFHFRPFIDLSRAPV